MNLHQQFAEPLSPLTKHDYGEASYDVCPKNRWKWQKYGEIFLNRDLVSIYVCSACEAAASSTATMSATTTTTNKDRSNVISVNGKQRFATGEIREFWRHVQQCHRDISNVFIANMCKEIELEPVNKKLKVSNVIVIDDYENEREGEDEISNDNRVCELASVQELAANEKAPLQRFEIPSSTNEISEENRQQNKSSVNSENASNTTLIQSEPIITNNQETSKITEDILMECNEEEEFISEQFYQIENQLREMHREAVDNEALSSKMNDADGQDPTKISNESLENENLRKSSDEICNKNISSYLNNSISESFVNLSEVIESHKDAEKFRLEASEDTSDTIEWSLATGENISDKAISRKGDEVSLEKFGILKSLLSKTENNNSNNNNKINNNNNNDPTIGNKNVSNIIEISDDEDGDNDDGNDNGEKYSNDFLISNNNRKYEKEQIINDATPLIEVIAPEMTQSGFPAQENYMDIDEFFNDNTNDYSNENDQLSSSYALEIPSNNQKQSIKPDPQNSHTFNGSYEQSITQVFDNHPQLNQSNNPNQPSTIPMVQIPKDLVSDNKDKSLYSERPFKCVKCGVRTCTHRRMKKHMLRQHPSGSENSSGKIQCQHCSQSYKSRGSVKRHMRKAHPEFYKNMTETITTNINAPNNESNALVNNTTVSISTHDDDTVLRNASNISSTIKQANSMNFHNSWHMERSLETHWSEGDDSSESIGVLLPANRDSESKLI